jgi:hypothetical protein
MAQTISIKHNGRKQRDKRANFREDTIYVESTLEENALDFGHRDITEDQIDWVTSLENRGRLEGSHDPTTSTRYQVAMENGELLPMPVVARQPNGLYRILGGYHSTVGAQNSGANIFPVYEVHVTDENKELVFEFLPVFLNMKNGKPLKDSDAMVKAVWAVKSKKRTVEQAAANFTLKVNALKDELRRQDLTTILLDNDVEGLDYFDKRKTTFFALGQLADNVPVFVAAAPVVIEGELTQDQALAFVRQIKEKKSERDMLDMVVQWHKDHVENKPKKTKQFKSNYSTALGWTKSTYSFLHKVSCMTQIPGGDILSPEVLWRDAQYYGEVGTKMRQLYLRQRALAVQQGLIKSELPEPEPEPEAEFEPDDGHDTLGGDRRADKR